MGHHKHAISKCDMYLIQALKVHTHAYVCMCVGCVFIYIYKDQTKTKCLGKIVKEDNKFKGRKKPQ